MKKRNKPPETFWVLVDMRGTILSRGRLRKASTEHGAEIPWTTVYGNRSSARQQISEIRKLMNQDTWKTWQFKAVQYRRA